MLQVSDFQAAGHGTYYFLCYTEAHVSSLSPVEQLKQELSTKKMLFQVSQLELTKVVGQGEEW